MSDELRAASGVEWRKDREQGVLKQLPISQRLVRLRTVRPDQLLRRGRIPDMLTSLVVAMIYGKVGLDDMDAFLAPREAAEEAAEMMESLRVVCEAALIEPRIVDEPLADDEISIDDLEIRDRSFIYTWAFAPAEVLSRFRYQPQADVEPVADEQRDAQPAQ